MSTSNCYFLESDEDMNTLLEKRKPILVMCMSSWCGHCKHAKPTFEEVARLIKGKGFCAYVCADGRYDDSTTENQQLMNYAKTFMQRHEIGGFPSFIKFDRYGNSSEFNGGRSKDALLSAFN